jgi:hypothetical protein
MKHEHDCPRDLASRSSSSSSALASTQAEGEEDTPPTVQPCALLGDHLEVDARELVRPHGSSEADRLLDHADSASDAGVNPHVDVELHRFDQGEYDSADEMGVYHEEVDDYSEETRGPLLNLFTVGLCVCGCVCFGSIHSSAQ